MGRSAQAAARLHRGRSRPLTGVVGCLGILRPQKEQRTTALKRNDAS